MRFDFELQTLYFSITKNESIGFLSSPEYAIGPEKKNDLRNRLPKPSDFGPKPQSTWAIRFSKIKNGTVF